MGDISNSEAEFLASYLAYRIVKTIVNALKEGGETDEK